MYKSLIRKQDYLVYNILADKHWTSLLILAMCLAFKGVILASFLGAII